MKTTLKIALLCVALAVMTACSTQKRAERRVRRAVELCPELVQVKAHLIDTYVTAPTFSDMATVPMGAVLSYDTIYAATDHGTIVVSLSQSDSSLRVGFVAAPQEIHYQDTISYAQVVVNSEKTSGGGFWNGFVWLIFGVTGGIWLCRYLLRNALKKQP